MAILSSPVQYIASTPLVAKTFAAATLVSSSVYLLAQWYYRDTPSFNVVPYVALVPGSSLFYPWTFITAGLVELNVLSLFFSLLFAVPSIGYLERLWGPLETLKFILITIGIPNFITFLISWLESVVIGMPSFFLYELVYYGQMGLQAGLLVAFTELIPEHQLRLFGVLGIRVKRLPMLYVTLSTVMCLIGYQAPWINIQWGWLVSWIYLRFYKRNAGETGVESYGDRSEAFAFVHWFPPLIHYPVSLISSFAYSIFSRLRLIPSGGYDVESQGYTQVPGSARAEAERRRALALKALDQRMASVSPAPGTISGTPSHSPQPSTVAAPAAERSTGDRDITDASGDKGKADTS